jgi:hypothetical protein
MPRVRVGNDEDLKALTGDDLHVLAVMSVEEEIRRRVLKNTIAHKQPQPDKRLAYVSWQDATKILRPHLSTDKQAKHHANYLWAKLFTESQFGLVSLEGYCTVCGINSRRPEPGEPWKQHVKSCPSRASTTARTMVFSRRSLIANEDVVPQLNNAWFRQWLKRDFGWLVTELKKQAR